MLEVYSSPEGGADTLERSDTELRSAQDLYEDLSEKQLSILDREASKVGLPEDLSGAIEIYNEDHPGEKRLQQIFLTYKYLLGEEDMQVKAQEIIELIK